ncbi:MAG: HD domain-containing phosphohydrolase [Phycisphaerales bacterium JB065]
MAIVGRQASATREYFPAPLASLDSAELSLDLYIRPSADSEPTLYRNAGLPFKEEDRNRLLEQGVQFLYIKVGQHAKYQAMLSNRVNCVMQDESLSGKERREIITGICSKLIEDAMENTSPEAIQSLFEVGNSIGQIASQEGDAAFSCLLNMSGHDFYTATHMMNVSIGCGLLARAVRPGDHEFSCAMIRAGLVHDLGKAEIDPAILNKEGRLTDEEFEAIKSHPMSGVRALRELGITDPIAIEVTRDHHEHLSGNGYPRGIDTSKIGVPARLAAVVDVYDALTSAKPYRAAIAWEDALRMMEESRGTQFDPDIFDTWKAVIAEATKEHADELPNPTAEVRSIDETMPHDEGTYSTVIDLKKKLGVVSKFSGHEQRVAERYSCNIRASITPLENGREAKHTLDGRLLDISKSGIRLASHTRMQQGAQFRVRASLGSGKHLDAMAKVVRPVEDPNSDGLWEHGCVLVKTHKTAKAA